MAREHLAGRDITDRRVLAAFRRVPREAFVTKSLQALAYEDQPLPIGEEQTISQPYIVALMTQLLDLNRADRVLEIGTGCGYQTAILAELVENVFTVEIIPTLAAEAAARLEMLGYENIRFNVGDGSGGWQEHAPYDKILVTAAPKVLPTALTEQLADGGALVAPVGDRYQTLVKVARRGENLVETRHGGVRFVPMTGASSAN
ncbi:MAG: protein-L-isoaspartate(D-aspartate) O-methyltransferase [Candidatus Poribacteria bacterium]|nr:protein-L-isoaspartate(D-aspartate) O-methyltransferase [Candidatus Poribacteria bacterium]